MYLSFHIFVVHYTYTLFKNHSVSVASVSAWVAFHLLTVIFCSEHISRFFLKKGVKKDSKLALLGSFKMSKQTLYLAYGFQNIRDVYQTQLSRQTKKLQQELKINTKIFSLKQHLVDIP